MERPINIRHVAAFVATAAHGSVTRAAKTVNLTQPALTQAIAKLEATLDCQLFERGPGGMRVTEPGQRLAPRAETALALIGSPRVTATQMRAFTALARTGSYSGAAERTGLSPASLHRSVADLSLALGERLVERRGRHLVLTRKGETRARNFGVAMAELRSGIAEIQAWLGKVGGRIVIGAMPLSRARWLPRSFLQFRRRGIAADIAIVEGSFAELVGPLRDGEVDFLLGALREECPEDLAQENVFDDRPQIVMRKDHPALSGGAIAKQDLAKAQWIIPAAPTPLRAHWEAMLRDAGIEEFNVEIECGSVLTIREMLLETDFLTLLSPDQLRVEIEAGLLVSATPPLPVSRSIGITTRQDWRPTEAQRAMLDILRAQATKLS